MEIALLHLVAGDLAAQYLLYVIEVHLQIVRVGHLLERELLQVRFAVTEHTAQMRIDLKPFAAEGADGHPDRGSVERIAIACFAFRQAFVPLPPLAHLPALAATPLQR